MKTAYAMPCTTSEQAEEMKKLCEKHGIKIGGIQKFDNMYITNNCGDIYGDVAFIYEHTKSYFGNKVIPYNPALFLYSLGVFPEKWCVRGSEEFAEFASSKKWSLRKATGKYQQCFYFLVDGFVRGTSLPGNVIPTDYIEVTLEDLIKHYEKPKTNDMKKVKCTNINNAACRITIGKVYSVIEEKEIFNSKCYLILDDDNEPNNYSAFQFEEVNQSKPTLKLTINRTELLEIHSIACSTWKTKISEYAKRLDLVSDTITFTESEVKEMFKAAVNDQPKVLERIFGNPRKSELLAEKEKLQKRVAEIDKELNI